MESNGKRIEEEESSEEEEDAQVEQHVSKNGVSITIDTRSEGTLVDSLALMDAGKVCSVVNVQVGNPQFITSSRQTEDLLDRILSHPNLKPTALIVWNFGAVIPAFNSLFQHVLTRLLEANGSLVRSLELRSYAKECNGKFVLTVLTSALQRPNCRVESISLFDLFPSVESGTLILEMLRNVVVRCERSRLSTIRLVDVVITSEGTRFLEEVLDHCPEGNKRHQISHLDINFPKSAERDLAQDLLTSDRLQRLKWFVISETSLRASDVSVAHQLIDALQRKGNRLRTLKVRLRYWGKLPLELARVLQHKNCRVRRLEVRVPGDLAPELLVGIAPFLCDPACTLQHFVYSGSTLGDDGSFTSIARAIRGGTRLKTLGLMLEHRGGDLKISFEGVLELIAAIKETPNLIRSLRLHVLFDSESILDALADCLLSPHNRIVHLELSGRTHFNSSAMVSAKFVRALRVSNIRRFAMDNPFFFDSFLQVLEDEWFWVMIAITSVHHIPRLRRGSGPLRMIPIGDFLPAIVDTLGWCLEPTRERSSTETSDD